MTRLADRFRARLVRRPLALEAPRPLLALPAPPRPRQPPAPRVWPVCPQCKHRHEPRPLPGPGTGGGGLAALYGRRLLPDTDRAIPLNRHADETALLAALQRDQIRHQP